MSVLATQEDRQLESAERRSSSSTAPENAVPLGPQQRLQSKRGIRRIASGLEGPATVPLRSCANASLFCIMLLLV